jgi:hypothetical protein
MKKSGSWRLMILVIFLFSIILTSCQLPFSIVPNPPEGLGTTNTPPPPTNTLVDTIQPNIPSPSSTAAPISILPVAGSILRWVDLSDFVYVPAGEFIMGEDHTESADNSPAHLVMLNGYWIHQAEVTNQQYALCVAEGKCTPPSKEPNTIYRYGFSTFANYPVVGVNWNQAQEYCDFIDARLPTEAEWEKAARGFEPKPYPWGEDAPTCDLLNFNDCLDPSEPDNVRSYQKGTSPFDLMDMSGNVFEWVSDWYSPEYYPASPANSPLGPVTGTKKVYRGGSYKSSPDEIGVTQRYSIEPEKHAADLGFRCVLVGESPIPPPPPCEVVALNDQQEQYPTFTPIAPCPPAEITAFCTIIQGNPAAGIQIQQSNCYDNEIFCVTGNSQGMNCDLISSNPKIYNCWGTNLSQGALINLGYCRNSPPPIQVTRECPSGYAYNFQSTFCEPIGSWLPDPPCPNGYMEVPPYGCFPAYQNGCPIGFYEVQFGANMKLCFPLDDCLLPDPPESCNPPVCPEGVDYDTDKQCCLTPKKLHQLCPIGFTFDQVNNMCITNIIAPYPCEYPQVTIPYCPTPTPIPTPLPCYYFTSESSCPDYCEWKDVGAATEKYECRPK